MAIAGKGLADLLTMFAIADALKSTGQKKQAKQLNVKAAQKNARDALGHLPRNPNVHKAAGLAGVMQDIMDGRDKPFGPQVPAGVKSLVDEYQSRSPRAESARRVNNPGPEDWEATMARQILNQSLKDGTFRSPGIIGGNTFGKSANMHIDEGDDAFVRKDPPLPPRKTIPVDANRRSVSPFQDALNELTGVGRKLPLPREKPPVPDRYKPTATAKKPTPAPGASTPETPLGDDSLFPDFSNAGMTDEEAVANTPPSKRWWEEFQDFGKQPDGSNLWDALSALGTGMAANKHTGNQRFLFDLSAGLSHMNASEKEREKERIARASAAKKMELEERQVAASEMNARAALLKMSMPTEKQKDMKALYWRLKQIYLDAEYSPIEAHKRALKESADRVFTSPQERAKWDAYYKARADLFNDPSGEAAQRIIAEDPKQRTKTVEERARELNLKKIK